MDLDHSPVDSLKGVGPALAEKLSKIGVTSLQDVLFHLPFRYEDRTRITEIAAVKPGDVVVLEGDIISADVAFGRRRSLLATLEDRTGRISLRFFHFTRAQQNSLSQHPRVRCFGQIRRGSAGLEIYHPEYNTAISSDLPDRLTPVYPATEGISQLRYRKIVAQVFALMNKGELLADLLKSVHPQGSINDALELVHQPPPNVNLEALLSGTHPAQQELAFEELLAHQNSLRLARAEANLLSAPQFTPPGKQYDRLLTSLGFTLTGAQVRVAREIAEDLGNSSPSLRLIQGDVGSGKTIIATLSAVQAQENGYQCALMAPTEILAEQHFINLTNWLEPLGISIAWLTGKIKGKKRIEVLANISNGDASIIVGTHALFQEDVKFNKLGLVIIDEQHRFGVHQRLALREKGNTDMLVPHQLVMTATPIPRTLTMSMYADMDCSTIDELPPGRIPVTTVVLPDTRREEVILRVKAACATGTQAYWVCTLIEESDVIECQAAEVTAAELADQLTELRIGLIHGRMSSNEKAATMKLFKENKLDLLVATTVIEVGVDVPNASLMVIENSERLGLAQLHQLRGRIGRGSTKSHCLLMYKAPLGETSRQRLNVMREISDGFQIAEEDLKIRGPGELFGTKQSGSVDFRIADLVRDHHMIAEVAKLSRQLVMNEPATARAIIKRWIRSPETYSQA
ncbi:MAG: ATP-dependent DNA helicase RecG [Pseudomonadales bacterium]|jgi:ATP-dependent DNA helicase RecG